METTALLIKKEELQAYLENITTTEETLIGDLERILPHIETASLKASLQRRLDRGKELMKALKAGFVPVAPGFYTRVDTKDKWDKKEVKTALASMPQDVKEVWEKVKEAGVFDHFSVTTGGGDPVLVGNKGGRHFFIAGWLPICPGVGVGIRVKLPSPLSVVDRSS